MFQMQLIKKLKTSYVMTISNNGKFLSHTMGSKTIVYDTGNWEKIVELSKPKHPGNIKFSKNDEFLFIKNTTGTICVYSTPDFKLYKTIQSRKNFQTVEADFAVTEDSLTILDTLKINDSTKIVTLNIETGTYKILVEVENTNIQYHHYIQNENAYLFTVYNLNEDGEVEQKLVKLENPITNPSYKIYTHPDLINWDTIIYDTFRNNYIMVNRYELLFLDRDFKTVFKKEFFIAQENQSNWEYFTHIHLSKNGKYLIVSYSSRIFILRLDDLETIFVEELKYPCFCEISNDNKYLLVGTSTNGFVLENNLE